MTHGLIISYPQNPHTEPIAQKNRGILSKCKLTHGLTIRDRWFDYFGQQKLTNFILMLHIFCYNYSKGNKQLKQFKKEHKFLFSSLVFSIIIAIVYYIFYCIYFFYSIEIVLKGLFLLTPVLLVALICFIVTKTFLKYPKTTKIISAILMTITIGYFQIFAYVVAFACASIFTLEPVYNTIDKYEEALQASNKQICIQHFPKKIPKNAKNIQFLRRYNNWFGSEEIYLKFDIDKNYIENELKKYKFNYKEGVEADNAEPTLFRHHDNILVEMGIPYKKREGFTFYIIHDYESETPRQNYFLYYYGIAVNKSKTTIVYFYENPD